ncbi:MAG: C40 family peptidase [Gemmatimonadales bacterium]|nr:C40 family peptidase [Gemmatimonadales bacterium]
MGFVLGAILVALFLVLSGCASKRVPPVGTASTAKVKKKLSRVDRSEQPAKKPNHKKERAGVTSLPEPKSRPRSGRSGYRTTAESLTLGIQAATLARDQIGKQYQWGAAGPDRFDCSGLTHYVFGNLGVDLPRVSREQARMGQKIGRSELQSGDLVFFSTSGSTINHVGIYLDNGKFVHAPRKHTPVRTDSLNDSWWRQRFRMARRLP